jgi:hypothetical protein
VDSSRAYCNTACRRASPLGIATRSGEPIVSSPWPSDRQAILSAPGIPEIQDLRYGEVVAEYRNLFAVIVRFVVGWSVIVLGVFGKHLMLSVPLKMGIASL